MGVPTPRRVPAGAVAIVGAVPIATSSFEHWLAIAARLPARSGPPARTGPPAVRRTISFLVKAQWLLQEATAEGVDESMLAGLVAQRIADAQPPKGMTRSDVALQTRLDVIAEALQRRHGTVSVSTAQVARYYAAHRAEFVNPAVRDTLMVVTRDRASALRARAALASGQRWAVVARHWSIDSSVANDGAYAVVEGVQSPTLVHAVFAARPGQITGPVRATPATQPTVTDYYLFEVTGERPASPQPLGRVTGQIRQTLAEQERPRALAAFTRAYELRWRSRTLCATGYVVPECRNAGGGR